MKGIFRNMKPYLGSVVLILLLLIIQAFGDLALPSYTSDIIDTGIQDHGVEHILPEKITDSEFELAELLMNEKEKTTWEKSYKKDGSIYVRTVNDEKKLDELDESMMTPIVMTYQMANMSEDAFRKMLTEQSAKSTGTQTGAAAGMQAAPDFSKMPLSDIGNALGVELKTFEAEENGKTVTYVDVRPLIRQMTESGMLPEEVLSGSRKTVEETMDKIGSTTLSSMGIAYAAARDREAGVDVDRMQKSYLFATGRKMFLIAMMMMLTSIGAGFFASRVGAGIGRDLREKIFSRVVAFSSTEMDRFSTASLITRSTNDIQQIQMVTTMMLRLVLYAPILGIGGVIRVIGTGANMGGIIVLAVLMVSGFIFFLMALAMPKFKIMQKLVDRLNLVSREILTGLSVIRAFGREKTEEARFDDANKDLMQTQLFTNRVMTMMMPGMTVLMNLITLLIVWISAHRIDDGTLQVGTMTAFITYTMQIVMSFLMLSALSIVLPRAAVASERIEEVLETEPTIEEKETTVHRPQEKAHRGTVAFNHVNFRYPGAEEDVLSDIDFTAEPGKVTAIIGSTGCGKSTLVNLIPRFYDVTDGQITLDGVDIRDLPLSELRAAIGFVPQRNALFSGTIASNLRFGKEDASEQDLIEAAGIAQAEEFIDTKPEGYESPISQGGNNVSGGQKQRLAIARALVKKADVFVFDDSFSALDMKTDAKLRHALADKVSDTAIIIVAQRISTILHADQILVLDDGRIAAKGTHKELLANSEVYRQIAKSQLSEEEIEKGA